MMKRQRGWKHWEAEVTDDLGLRATIASGSQFHDQGDAQSTEHYTQNDFGLFVDCKYTEAKSFSITRNTWANVQDQASHTGRRPVLAVRIWPQLDRRGVSDGFVWTNAPMDLAVICMNDFVTLLKDR